MIQSDCCHSEKPSKPKKNKISYDRNDRVLDKIFDGEYAYDHTVKVLLERNMQEILIIPARTTMNINNHNTTITEYKTINSKEDAID